MLFYDLLDRSVRAGASRQDTGGYQDDDWGCLQDLGAAAGEQRASMPAPREDAPEGEELKMKMAMPEKLEWTQGVLVCGEFELVLLVQTV